MKARVRSVCMDLLAAVVAFWVIFSVAYVFGRISVPSFRAPSVASVVAGGEGLGQDGGTLLLDDIHLQLAGIPGSAAIVAASGAVDGRFVLDHVDSAGVEFRQGGPPDLTLPVALKVKLSGGGATLSIVGREVVLGGGPQQISQMTIVFTAEGKTFLPEAGDCVLEFLDSGLVVEEVGEGRSYHPSIIGQVSCSAVAALRTGETVSFSAAFRYEPEV
ncbi:MAG: hypothetical protein WEE36_07910 [Acidimicrobiia bacterium]